MPTATTEIEPASGNTNCLAGIRCPACGHEDSFLVTCAITVRLIDNGVDDDWAFKHGDGFEWGPTSPMHCTACGHQGTSSQFTIANQQPAVDEDEPDEDSCGFCHSSLDDGEGFDGFCGNCADLIESHLSGGHEDRGECPSCNGIEVVWT